MSVRPVLPGLGTGRPDRSRGPGPADTAQSTPARSGDHELRWTVDGAAPGRLVSGAGLRAATAWLVLVAAVVAVAGDSAGRFAPLSVLAGVLVLAGTALAPTTPVPTLGLLALAAVVVDRDLPLWHVVLLAGLLHAVHLLVAWCAAVPVGARLPVSALGPTVRRWALAQLLALPVALGVAVGTPSGDRGRGTGAAAVLAALALLGVSLVLVRLARAAVRG